VAAARLTVVRAFVKKEPVMEESHTQLTAAAEVISIISNARQSLASAVHHLDSEYSHDS